MANPSRTVLTPEFRMSFCHMITAKEFIENGKKTGKFSYITDSLFKPEDCAKFKMLQTAEGANQGQLVDVDLGILLRDLALEAWGTSMNPETNKPWTVKEMFAGVAIKGWPLKNGDTIAEKGKAKGKDYEQYRGLKVLSIKSNVSEKTQPPILSQQLPGGKHRVFNRVMPEDMQTAKLMFQGGNYAFATLNIVANVVGGMKFLTPYVNSIRYTREGSKFGRQGDDLMSKFAGVAGGTSDHNPMDEASDEIPF